MGEVYRVRDIRLDRDAALKVIRSSADRDDEAMDRSAARRSHPRSQLNHPNIASPFTKQASSGAIATWRWS
jgi:serine/threonine protein kinase